MSQESSFRFVIDAQEVHEEAASHNPHDEVLSHHEEELKVEGEEEEMTLNQKAVSMSKDGEEGRIWEHALKALGYTLDYSSPEELINSMNNILEKASVQEIRKIVKTQGDIRMGIYPGEEEVPIDPKAKGKGIESPGPKSKALKMLEDGEGLVDLTNALEAMGVDFKLGDERTIIGSLPDVDCEELLQTVKDTRQNVEMAYQEWEENENPSLLMKLDALSANKDGLEFYAWNYAFESMGITVDGVLKMNEIIAKMSMEQITSLTKAHGDGVHNIKVMFEKAFKPSPPQNKAVQFFKEKPDLKVWISALEHMGYCNFGSTHEEIIAELGRIQSEEDQDDVIQTAEEGFKLLEISKGNYVQVPLPLDAQTLIKVKQLQDQVDLGRQRSDAQYEALERKLNSIQQRTEQIVKLIFTFGGKMGPQETDG